MTGGVVRGRCGDGSADRPQLIGIDQELWVDRRRQFEAGHDLSHIDQLTRCPAAIAEQAA